MKTNFLISTVILVALLLSSCQKDDGPSFEEQILPEPEEEIGETNTKPTMAVLTTPEDGKELVSALPLLQWNASTDPEGTAITYTVAMGPSEIALTTVIEDISATEHQLVAPLEKGTMLYWSITAEDTSGENETSEIHQFTTEFITPKPITEDAAFSKRSFSTVTAFLGNLWLIGGQDEDSNILNEIWRSTDGENWEQVTNAAPFGSLNKHNALVFANKLWVFNGADDGLSNNKIWYTENGSDWTMASETTPFYHQLGTMFVFDNKIWRLAGYYGDTEDLSPERNVWNSSDGIHWVLVSENHGFDRKYGMAVVPFQGKLIGLEGSQFSSDRFTKVRESYDGIHWSVIAEDLPFNFGTYSDGQVLNGKLYMTGGSGYRDLWFTEDGREWQKAVNERGYPERYTGSSAVLDNKLYVVGGGTHSNSYNDVWVLE